MRLLIKKRDVRLRLRFVGAGLLFFTAALIGAGRCAAQDDCEVFFSSRGLTTFMRTADAAAEAEKRVRRDASNIETLMQLLDYYECHWKEPESRASRTRIILWAIQNHPDLHFIGGHDDGGLFINPDDKDAYAQARGLWLEKVEQYPYFPDVLANAAYCLRLTDRAKAATWLKSMGDYGRVFLEKVYADAIAGVTGEAPLQGITSVDPAERDSDFAKSALEDSGRDKELAARVGWDLHVISNAFRYEKVDSADLDPLAERLLLKSAELTYPQSAEFSYLDPFYRSQTLKPVGQQVLSKAKLVHVAPEEQATRFVSGPGRTRAPLAEPLKVTVDVVVGVDGHVWEAVPRNAAPETASQAAARAVRSFVYLPLKVDGQTVRVATSVEVMIEPRRVVDQRRQGVGSAETSWTAHPLRILLP